MEKVAWMKGGADRNSIQFHPCSAKTGDGGLLRAEKSLYRGGAECDDDGGGDNGHLGPKVGQAGVHLGSGRFAVATGVGGHVGAALQDVGDVDLFAGEFHGRDHFGEEFAGEADERLALFVLLGSGSFADEHQLGFGIAHAENDLSSGFGEMRADFAGVCFFSESRQLVGFGSADSLENGV